MAREFLERGDLDGPGGAVDFLTKPFNDQELLDAFSGTELQRSAWIMRLYPYLVFPDTPWGSARAVGFDILYP